MPKCDGNTQDHCCYLNGKPCDYLEKNTVADRRWACGLLRELGDWDSVLASDRYIDGPGAHFGPMGMDCKSYPDPSKGQFCFTCGKGSRKT